MVKCIASGNKSTWAKKWSFPITDLEYFCKLRYFFLFFECIEAVRRTDPLLDGAAFVKLYPR